MLYKLREYISLFWQLLLAVLDYAIWKHPFTFMLIPWLIHDSNGIIRYPSSILLVAITCTLDYMLPLVAIDVYDYRFYRKIKKDRDSSLSGHLTVFESGLVDRLLVVTKKGLKSVLETRLLPINDSIKVVYSDKKGASAATYSSVSNGAIVVLRQQLENIDEDKDEEEDMDEEKKKKKEKEKEKKRQGYYLLAHELGHALHSLSAFHYSFIPVVTAAFELLLVCHLAFNLKSSNVNITIMVFSFNLCATILMLYGKYLIFNSELQADLAGISIIKGVFGDEKMGKAASYYLKHRIINARSTKSKKQFFLNRVERKRQLDCIKTLVRYVSQKDKEKLFGEVYPISKDIEATFEKEAKESLRMASTKWSIDKQIQKALTETNGDESAPFASGKHERLIANLPAPYPSEMLKDASFLSLFYRMVAVGTVAFITATLDNYTYTWEYRPLLIAFVLYIVFYSINYLIIKLLWKKTKQLLERIGI